MRLLGGCELGNSCLIQILGDQAATEARLSSGFMYLGCTITRRREHRPDDLFDSNEKKKKRVLNDTGVHGGYHYL